MKKITPIARFIFGLALLAWLFFGIPAVIQQSSYFIIMVSLTTLLPVSLPLVLAALYFIFTGKFRWRFDILALIIAVVCLVALNRMLNINRFLFQNNIKGEVKLEVTVLRENHQPVANLEVDMARTPGQPPEGGVAQTDNKGIAVFYLRPNTYARYFNGNNFPQDLQQPENLTQVKVEKDKINQQTIILKSNSPS
jgi:hypothetical protein